MSDIRRPPRHGWAFGRFAALLVLAATAVYSPSLSSTPQQAIPRRPADRPSPARPEVGPGQIRLPSARAEAFAEAALRGLDYVPGEVIVKFNPAVSPASQQRALMALRSRPDVASLEWRGDVAVLRDPSQRDAHVLADQLSLQPEVQYAEPNYLARIDPILNARVMATGGPPGARPSRIPSDPDYAAYQWNFSLINMPGVWDVQPGGRPEIIVAVVDTGITVVRETRTYSIWTGSSFQNVDFAFDVNPDLPASRLVLPRDFIFHEPDGPVLDMDGHGTHVSGTIAQASNNGLLVSGIAYNVRIMPVKVCTSYWEVMVTRGLSGITGFAPSSAGSCPFSDIAAGVRYAADNGANVINISLGGSSSSTTMRDALSYAVQRGVFVSLSMGNDFEDGDPIHYPARYAQDFAGVMAVASVGKFSDKAYYSSTGSHAEIAAPGGDSRVGGGADRGLIWQSTLLSSDTSPFITFPRFDRYDKVGYQGTSMAAPHIAGVAALLMAQVPGITPAQIERLLESTARDLGATGRDNSFGFGLVQPRNAIYGLGIRR